MKQRLGTNVLNDDANLWNSLILLGLLILLLLFLLWPKPLSTTTAPVADQVVFKPRPLPAAVSLAPAIRADARVDYVPPPTFYQPAPVPTPTPPGGGVLRKIAFASNRADGRFYQIFMMDADGNHLEQLMASTSFDRDPHFSHSGEWLAFSSNRTGTYQIYILDLSTRAVRQLTDGPADKTNPFFSPDDHHILFTQNRNGSSELGLMNADGSDVRQLTDTFGDSHGYGFSPDGTRVSFESTMNNRNEIFTLDLASRKANVLIETDELSYRGDPVFSPLGKRLVFSSNVLERGIRQLYIYDLDWKKYYRITDDEIDKDDPLFSPDGTLIAYVGRWENAWNIFVMDADGQHVRNLTKSYFDHVVPSWR